MEESKRRWRGRVMRGAVAWSLGSALVACSSGPEPGRQWSSGTENGTGGSGWCCDTNPPPCDWAVEEVVDLTDPSYEGDAPLPPGGFGDRVLAAVWSDGVERPVTVHLDPDLTQVTHYVPAASETRSYCEERFVTPPAYFTLSWEGESIESVFPYKINLLQPRYVITANMPRNKLPAAVRASIQGREGKTRWQLDYRMDGQTHGGVFSLLIGEDGHTGTLTVEDREVHATWGEGLDVPAPTP